MKMEQQHEMLVEILAKLIPVLSADELSLLSYHLGIKQNEFYDPETYVDEKEMAQAYREWFWSGVERYDASVKAKNESMYEQADLRRKEFKESAL